jgi:hypothetical protein
VALDGFWPVFPTPSTPATASPPEVVSLVPGLYVDRPVGASLRRTEMVLDVPATKTLLRPARPGSRRVRISDATAIAIGSVLAFESSHADRVEHIAVVDIDPGSTPTQPATVVLAHALRTLHHEGTAVTPAAPQPPGGVNSLTRPAIAGDPCAFLDGLVDLGAAQVVAVSGGTPPVEYHAVRRYTATTGTSGGYRLPPLSRAALVRLAVTHASLSSVVRVTASPDYGGSEYRIDVIGS